MTIILSFTPLTTNLHHAFSSRNLPGQFFATFVFFVVCFCPFCGFNRTFVTLTFKGPCEIGAKVY